MTSVAEIVSIANSIKDNMWLGDIEEIKKLCEKVLENKDKVNDKFLSARTSAVEEYRDTKRSLKEEYRYADKKIGKQRLNHLTSENFRKKMVNSGIDINDALVGSIVENISLLDVAMKECQTNKIEKTDSFKFVSSQLAGKYSVRMLMTKDQAPNNQRLLQYLDSAGLKTGIIGESKTHLLLASYLEDGYVEITIFAPCVSIIISLLNADVERAEKIARGIMDSVSAK